MSELIPPLHVKRRLAMFLAIAVGYSLICDLSDYVLQLPTWRAGTEITAALASVLTILMAFRINAANNRWWEARTLWGQLNNDIRNLSLKVIGHADVAADERRQFARLLIAFPHALRLHLREEIPTVIPGLDRLPPPDVHLPGYIAGQIHDMLGRWNREGRLADAVWVLDTHARGLLDVVGACERIRNTRMPSSYRCLIRLAILTYIVISPWCAALDAEWWCTPILSISFFFLIGMEVTAEDIEQPFGLAKDDLPLETYCENIQKFILSFMPDAMSASSADSRQSMTA